MELVSCNNCASRDQILLTRTTNVGPGGKRTLEIVVCRTCGLCYLNPRPGRETYDGFYETYGRQKAETRTLIEEKYFQKEYIDWLEEDLSRSDRILDVGCGKAVFLHLLRERGYRLLFGIDLSTKEIGFAKKVFGFDVVRATVEDYRGRNFNLVTLIAVIEHLRDPRTGLGAVHDLLKDGGLLFISTPDVKNMVLRKGISNYFKFVHTYYFSMTTLKSIVQQAGFAVVREKIRQPEIRRGWFFPRHYRDGELWLLAKKIGRPEKSRISPLKDKPQEIISILGRAKRRDFVPALIYKLDQWRGLGLIFRCLGWVGEKIYFRGARASK